MNRVLEEIAVEQKARFIDLSSCFGPDDFSDALHPNESGHEKIFQVVALALISFGIIPPE
jgi:hypothetical protein